MGETHSSDLLSKGMDEAFSEKEPEKEEVVVEETQETETIAPDVSETQETEEAVQETVTETETEEGDRLDPLFGRLKDVSDNDRDMISRHYEKAQERDAIQEKFEEAERKIAELEGRDTFGDQANRIFDIQDDPKIIEEHRQFRALHGDQEYVMAVGRMKAQEPQNKDSDPEEDPRDVTMRKMQYRMEQIEKRDEEREKHRVKEEGDRLFTEHSAKAWGELKVPDGHREYLSEALSGALAVSTVRIDSYDKLRKLAKAVWGKFESRLKSEQTATKETLVGKTTKVVQKDDDEIPEAVGEDELDKFEDSRSCLKKGMDEAERAVPESGAA